MTMGTKYTIHRKQAISNMFKHIQNSRERDRERACGFMHEFRKILTIYLMYIRLQNHTYMAVSKHEIQAFEFVLLCFVVVV